MQRECGESLRAHEVKVDAAAQKAKLTPKAVQLKLALRDLWVGHIFWVRNAVLTTTTATRQWRRW